MNITKLSNLEGFTQEKKIKMIEDYLYSLGDELGYILTHLDSSNIIEIDTAKTNIYKGEDNELQ